MSNHLVPADWVSYSFGARKSWWEAARGSTGLEACKEKRPSATQVPPSDWRPSRGGHQTARVLQASGRLIMPTSGSRNGWCLHAFYYKICLLQNSECCHAASFSADSFQLIRTAFERAGRVTDKRHSLQAVCREQWRGSAYSTTRYCRADTQYKVLRKIANACPKGFPLHTHT